MSMSVKIPKIIHYVWVGPRPFPDDARAHLAAWKRLLPDYGFMAWTEANIDFSPRFLQGAYAVGAYNRVANYVRMAALARYGGVYLDHDVELLKPLDPFLGDGCFAGFQTMDANATDIVNVAVMGAAPGHPLILRALDALNAMDGGKDVGSGSGPGLFSRVLRELGPVAPQAEPLRFHDATLYPPRYFYPYEWFDEFSPDCVTADTVAIHRWAHTWKPDPTRWARLQRKAIRGLARLSAPAMAAWRRARNLRLRSLADVPQGLGATA